MTPMPTTAGGVTGLAMLGLQDSDGDGVFDVVDVPLTLVASNGLVPDATQAASNSPP